MIQVSSLTTQTLQPGQSLVFGKVNVKSSCKNHQCFNSMLPTSVKLCSKGIHDVSFHANITSTTAGAVLQLALALEGQPIVTTAMQAVPAAAGNLVNVSARTLIKNCCCDADRISVINTGATPVTITQNATLIVE